ncbi:unnamed protein product, partial [Linum tenue]
LPTGATYTDPITEIPYIADDAYITTGVNSEISSIHISDDLPVPLRTLRSFPEGDRATFLYGNYDVNRWASLRFDNASHVVNKEIIHVPPLDHIYICLVNTGLGTPFISALEVRHFHNSTYTSVCGTINTTLTIDSVNRTDFNLPSKVMKTATRPTDENKPLSFELNTREATLDFYIYMHFAELEALQEGESRVFDISLNGIVLRRNVVPIYLHSTTITSPQSVRGSKLNFLLSKSMNSTHPPILNALEVFVIRPFWQSPTDQADGECFMVQWWRIWFKLSMD